MRHGYQPDFLSSIFLALPKPGLSLAGDVLVPEAFAHTHGVVPYIHYSLLVSRSTRQAIYSAANVDLNAVQTVSGAKGRKWFIDSRVGSENQVTNEAYTHTPWDRGHLTRRTAVAWGDYPTALAASNDSCAYTNATLQHKNFNEDEWRLPERAVDEFSMSLDGKLAVMTGPIFTRCDRFFSKGFGFEPVRVPTGFWKTLTYLDSREQLVTTAFMFLQDLESLKNSQGTKQITLKNFRVTTTELELWTGLSFDSQMFTSNPLKFYSSEEGAEIIPVGAFKELDTEAKALLAAGVATNSDVMAARKTMALPKLYALIDELAWY